MLCKPYKTAASTMNAIQALPEIFQLTPVRDKKPYIRQWQTTAIPRRDIADAIASGKATGFGLRLGVPSSGVMALDIDGAAPRALLAEIMGAGELPMTVEFTSGKPDRSQMLFQVPEQYWDALKPKKKSIASGDTTEDLDFRWNGNQSVLPPSAHPETDGYQWIEGKSPDDVSIAELPTTLLEYWLNLIDPPRIAPAVYLPKPTETHWAECLRVAVTIWA
jgi:Bifunctional DNA primase/polymerase, N-terminal